MLTKLKYLVYAGMVMFVIALAVSRQVEHNGRLREKADRLRLQENQRQYLQDSQKFVFIELKMREFIETITPKVDSILKAEKIKPKNVTNIIERHYVYRDTSYASYTPEPVKTIDGIIFPFIDIKDCIRIDGFVRIDSLRPTVTITNREFQNNSIDVGYIKREKKLWFIAYGKWRAKLKTVNECGETTTKEIKIIKE